MAPAKLQKAGFGPFAPFEEKTMIEIRGKYNQAKIFTDVVDSASIAQVQELCN